MLCFLNTCSDKLPHQNIAATAGLNTSLNVRLFSCVLNFYFK